jgi:predicted RNase H-like HicB family nuclease
MKRRKSFVASDGKIQIVLTPCEEGGYLVTSHLDPALITQAESLEEAFENAHDCIKELAIARREVAKRHQQQKLQLK